jgi:hypothetical protein
MVFQFIRLVFCLGLTLILLLYLIVFTVKYSIDVPSWDDWMIVPLLEKSYQGTLTVNDFLADDSHPHRIAFPRLIILISARLTGWNIKYQYLINILLGVGIFSVVIAQLKSTIPDLLRSAACWLIPVFGIFVFSLSQWENWFWGWQICIFLNVWAVLNGIYLLSHPKGGWIRFTVAIGLGVIATFSFANGLLFWPIGLLIIVTSTCRKRSKWFACALWALFSLSILKIYLYYPDPLRGGWFGWNGNLSFVLRYLGTPLMRFGFGDYFEWRAVRYVGFFSIVIVVINIFVLLRYCRISIRRLAPWISLILYAIGSGVLTSLGRTAEHSVSSRYVTISSLYWLSSVVVLFLIVRHIVSAVKPGATVGLIRLACAAIIVIIVLMAGYQSLENARVFRYRSRELQAARDRLSTLHYGDSSILGHHCRTLPVRHLILLKKYQLSVFRER